MILAAALDIYLTSNINTCVVKCPEGTALDTSTNMCAPCHLICVENKCSEGSSNNNNEDKCTECADINNFLLGSVINGGECVISTTCPVAIEKINNNINKINECLDVCPDRMMTNENNICRYCHNDCKKCVFPED